MSCNLCLPPMRFATFAAGALLAAACATSPRFSDAPIVWKLEDREHIPEPRAKEYQRIAERIEQFGTRRLTRLLELRDKELAHNVNNLDEVPNSTWFTNRIGIRNVSPEEAALGASQAGPPKLPLSVTSGKPGGKNPGLVAEDAEGRKFVIKFDRKSHPEMETATNVIVNRIFWTLGYNVPNDTVFQFVRRQLKLAPNATAEDETGAEKPMTPDDIEAVLATTATNSERRYRATASEFVPGVPKGGWPTEGTRADDPNDVIPHEHRREVRAIRVFAAWLNHTDMKRDNTLDTYVHENGRGYLMHYLIDFGEAFGSFNATGNRRANGFEHWLDYGAQPGAALSLGLWLRPWETLEQTRWPSIGRFSAENFDPDAWHEMFPYWPFSEADAADKYWAAKLVMRFDRRLLQRIVLEGQLSDPAAAEYLVDVLYERRRRIGAQYFGRVSPLDHFRIRPQEVCTIDLAVRHGLVTGGLVEALNAEDDVVFDQLVAKDGTLCIPIPNDAEYRIYRLRVRRGNQVLPTLRLHFKGGAKPRILGIERLERL